MISEKYDEWSKSQEGQTDAYSFEESYVKFMDEIGHQMLQEIVGHEKDERKKNDRHALR